MEWIWKKANPVDIVKFASDAAIQYLPLHNIDTFGLRKEEKLDELIQVIYDALLSQKIRYEYEKFDNNKTDQRIRTPEEIISTKFGTCLDLSLLFCGLCLGYGLLPKLVILEGHAFVLVSRKLAREEFARSGEPDSQERFWGTWNEDIVQPDILRDKPLIEELIDKKRLYAIECTGFASISHSKRSDDADLGPDEEDIESAGMQRNEDGCFSFAEAIEAGKKQINRLPFRYALDIAVFQHMWGIEPHTIADSGDKILDVRYPRWGSDPKVGKNYKIVSKVSGMVLDVANESKAEGDKIILFRWNNQSNQIFKLIREEGDSSYSFRSNHSSMCLAIPNRSLVNNEDLVQWHCLGSEDQKFTLLPSERPLSPGNQLTSKSSLFYKIQCLHSKQLLTVNPSDYSVFQYDDKDLDSQLFYLLLVDEC